MLIFFLPSLDILLHERLCIYESNPISTDRKNSRGIPKSDGFGFGNPFLGKKPGFFLNHTSVLTTDI
ncbi:MAG: hypothetical protein DRI57_14970 [Deltaproteobacteria bacterium]|nr:MAG: hypothetical protein DRI57_14970 [Deltaproteobacteria bacterium]